MTAVSFRTHTFWGRPEYVADCWELRRGARDYHRLFKWGAGYRYVTHEPPTVVDEQGRDLRSLDWVRAEEMAGRGVFMYHYSLLFPWQVEQKVRIYQDEKPEMCAESSTGRSIRTSGWRGRIASTTCTDRRAGSTGSRASTHLRSSR